VIVTITANPALDRVIFIDAWRPETSMRSPRSVDYVGGKGFDISVALAGLGVPSLAFGLMAGQVGWKLVSLLDGYGIEHALTWCEGETRIAHVIVETDLGRHSHIITPGFHVPLEKLSEFLDSFRAVLTDSAWVLASGSIAPGLPADFYRTVVEAAHRAGAKALLDTTGAPALAALPARPEILKLNRAEFAATFPQFTSQDQGAGLLDFLAPARKVRQEYALPNLVVTAGADGILALTGAGEFKAAAPAQRAVNAAGAGDAASAALAWRLSLGESWAEALCWATASGAACVLTEGTAEVRLDDVHRLLPQVVVETL
jgi:1-phosphofructokinase family hexose kinase